MAPFPVVVHPYVSPTRGSCAYELGNTKASNALVFIGGLTDGPHTVAYIRTIAKLLEGPSSSLDYSVFEFRMRSSFMGFGTSSLSNDVADISALVKYLRGIGKRKVVLLGHSTGCQDCMEYTDYSKHGNEPVEGFIMQAPVSDREAFVGLGGLPNDSIEVAEKMVAEGKANDLIPMDKVPPDLGAPMSAYRLLSLLTPGGDDDYFSSDLAPKVVSKFWSRFKQPVLVLHSEEDPYVPGHISQEDLNDRYQAQNPLVSPLSGLIPETGHAVLEEEAQEWMAKRVAEFLETIK